LNLFQRSGEACMPACLPTLPYLYLPRYSEPCTCHEVKSVVRCRIHCLCKCTRAFQPAPLQPSDVGETRWHRTYGRKVEKETEKKKKKKRNSARKTASAENLLCPRTQPTVDGHLPRYFYYSELGLFFNSFRFHFHFHFHFLPQGQCPFPRSTSLTSQASTPNSARAPAYQ
jgi:hypothetical protein